MSWGWRITILYIGFVALILTLVFKSMNQKVDLVTEDYYQQELKFQQKIDASQQAGTLAEQPVAHVTANSVEIKFPQGLAKQPITGSVKFYRPSDATKDVKMDLQVDSSGVQQISSAQLQRGLYQVQLTWAVAGKAYYNELPVYIP